MSQYGHRRDGFAKASWTTWFGPLSPTATLGQTYPIPFELGSQLAQGPASTGVGDRLGSPPGAVGET